MDDLLAELEEEIRSAKIEMKSLKKDVKLQMSLVMPATGETHLEKEALTFPGPCHTFGKSERFKEPSKNNDEQDIFGGESVYSQYQDYISPQAYEAIQQKKPNTIFSKSQRFIEPKKDEIQLPIEPNYDFVKKRAPQPTICPKKQSIYTPAQKKLLQSGFSQNDLDEMETQASMSQVGPGAYSINYSVLESGRGVALTKEPRFREIKPIEQLPIQPNYDFIRQKPPLVKISRKTERNKKLQLRDQIRQLEEEDQANQYKRRQLDLHNAIKPHAPQAIIMRDYKEIVAAAVGSKQRRFLIMKLMDELKFKCLGPGAYDIAPQRSAPCAVVYRPHSAESKRLIIDDRPSPGPDYYYSKDDLIKTRAIVHAFGNEPRVKQIKQSDLDLRPDLNINIEAIKNKAPAISIAPEQTTHAIIPDEDKIIEQRRGPGAYQPQMKIIEARSDKGAVKLQPLNERNDRANEINLYEKEIHDYDVQLFPALDAIKPHIQAFTYHEPTEHKPQHMPDAKLFPEKWDFYDANIEAVKERVGEAVPHFGGKAGRGLIEFLRYQEHLDNFRDYMKRQDYIPEIGQYNVQYDAVDPDRKAVDFLRYQERDIGPIEKQEGDVAGDNLILNPHPIPQHIQNIDFQKYPERPQGPVAREDPELDLNPNVNVIKPSVKQVISFDKMLERPQPPQQQEQELLIEPQFVQVDRKVIGMMNFDKQLDRQEDPRFNLKVDDNELIIEPKQDVIKPKIKGGIKMEKGGMRFQKLNPEKDKIPPPVNASRIEKAEKYMRPNIAKINMKSTSSRGASIKQKK